MASEFDALLREARALIRSVRDINAAFCIDGVTRRSEEVATMNDTSIRGLLDKAIAILLRPSTSPGSAESDCDDARALIEQARDMLPSNEVIHAGGHFTSGYSGVDREDFYGAGDCGNQDMLGGQGRTGAPGVYLGDSHGGGGGGVGKPDSECDGDWHTWPPNTGDHTERTEAACKCGRVKWVRTLGPWPGEEAITVVPA